MEGLFIMKKWYLSLLAVFALVILGACSSSDSKEEVKESELAEQSSAEKEAKTAIEITDAMGNTHTFDAPPTTIATLNPGELDILLALEANVVGRPSLTTEMTPEVEALQELGNTHEPSFEQIAALNPEVLIVPQNFARFAANVEAQGTKVIYSHANSVEEIKKSITMLGTLVKKEDKAAELNKVIDDKLASITAKSDVRTLLVYGAPGTYLAALDTSLSGDILKLAGGENIAADFQPEDKYPQYASLSPELIVERNPEVVMLITHANPQAVQQGFEKQMSENAAWKNLDAVKSGKIIVLPANLFGNNPGTKIIEALDYMIQTLNEVK